MRAIFRADDQYYRANGFYDFPQYNYRKRIMNWSFSIFMSIPAVQRKVKPRIRDHMIEPFSRVFIDNPLLHDLSEKREAR